MNHPRKLKILWAVDAFDDLETAEQIEVKILQFLSVKTEIEIDPIYVLSPTELGISLAFSVQWTDAYAPAARKALDQRIKDVSIPGLRKPQVLIQHQASLKGTVEALTKYAAFNSYDLIVAGSHGRKGLQRVLLGSFSELLLLQSKIPILIIGRHVEEWSGEEMQILLPNDFSDLNSPLFPVAYQFAKILEARISLLHSIPRPSEQVFQSGVYLLAGGWVPVPVYLEKERIKKENNAAPLLIEAKKHNVDCDILVDDSTPSVTESILIHAKEKKAKFIIMAAESGPVASALLGSITRQILRTAPCPVLVCRFK